MAAIFVTATGTDIGKTFVTAGLIRHLHARGRRVDACKPVVSGFDPADATASDLGILLAALGRGTSGDEIARISPWRFRAPLSPDMAALCENRSIDFDALVEFSYAAIAANDDGTTFIEGIGGIMVPLDQRHTVLDWMTALHVPILLVAGSYLGAISHVLTCLEVLTRRGLSVAAVAISESPASSVTLDDTAATVARFSNPISVIAIPRLPKGEFAHPVFGRLAALL
ncbi:MAG: dethiobiotin synthase [Rhizobiales bacterium]|nr:dethiobiotin synthase [Hyphomicrobiales bacterium]